jgi:hypothetical protein
VAFVFVIFLVVKGHKLVGYLVINEVQSEIAFAAHIIPCAHIPLVVAVFFEYLKISSELL